MRKLTIPISDEAIRELKVGEPVLLSGVILTGRDAVHKWMIDTFIEKKRQPEGDDLEVYEAIKPLLDGGIIYHCGPVVSGVETGDYKFVAAGPTTSIREEPYQALIMEHFNLKGVIGKGGMGPKTLQGCQDTPAVYFHAIGGAASLIAQSVKKVNDVHKLDFGVPEAMWVIDVVDFPVVVTMDSHGGSQHAVVEENSKKVLNELLAKG
jgi:fumarate hydratase class I